MFSAGLFPGAVLPVFSGNRYFVRTLGLLLCAFAFIKVRCSLISALLPLTSCTSYTHRLTTFHKLTFNKAHLLIEMYSR
jgi:hypothetical protein